MQKQIHKRLTTDQVKTILQGYCDGTISAHEAIELLEIKRSRFFDYLKLYKKSPETFKVDYQRQTQPRLDESWQEAIINELSLEQKLIADPNTATSITKYNYSAIRSRLKHQKVYVSRTTIVNIAKAHRFYQPRRKKKIIHDRCVITSAVGALIQHDASIHLWSPYASEKWTLITSIDDYSRVILYADFVARETTWAHIKAAKELMIKYGIPLKYYVDQLRVFEYTSHYNSAWINQKAKSDEVITKWKMVMNSLNVQVIPALSPQAKGKVERPFGWLQDRIVRECAKRRISQVDDVREVLYAELDEYHNERVHSSTKEIPILRYQKAIEEGKTLFRPLVIPKPYQSLDDIFCIRETRRTDGYRKISLFNQKIEVPNTPPREEVDIHMVPKVIERQNLVEIRVWWKEQLVYNSTYPVSIFPTLHF